MASLVLYGSDVADATLTTACDMAATSGGTETSKVTAPTGGSGNFVEVASQGNAAANAVTSIPAPTGNGWVYSPGAGTFALGNWSPVLTFACTTPNAGVSTWRAYKYSGGTYTSIGSITFTPTSSAKTTYTLTATSMPATTFAASDLLYVDLWYQDNSGLGGDTATIYESTSATAGVANDMQVTTSNFTAGGITNNTMASTDALVVSDLGPALQSWPVDGLTATDSLGVTDTALPVDGLTVSDSYLATDTDLATDGLQASDLGGNLHGFPVDALTASDNFLATDTAQALEALSASDTLLTADGSIPIDANTVSDVGGSLQRWPVDAFLASDSLLGVDSAIPTESLTVADSLLGVDGNLFTEANSASDMGNLQLWPVDSLIASDTFAASDSYQGVEGQSVLESLLATDGASWVEMLAASDLSGMVSQAVSALLYLSATWVTRDGKATWRTRDLLATWKTRDEQSGWNTRDGQDSWKTRDEQATWKTRQ